MKRNTNRASRRVAACTLIAGAVGLCLATGANADSQAARKMGQMGVINQTLQPKAVHSSPGYSNNANPNTTNPGYNANSTYNPNAANANAANGAATGATTTAPKK